MAGIRTTFRNLSWDADALEEAVPMEKAELLPSEVGDANAGVVYQDHFSAFDAHLTYRYADLEIGIVGRCSPVSAEPAIRRISRRHESDSPSGWRTRANDIEAVIARARSRTASGIGSGGRRPFGHASTMT
jgi:hypothetical protein